MATISIGCGYVAEMYPVDDAREVTISGSRERHDLAITAVDTDPAWVSRVSVPGGSVSLLAVVENKGNIRETGIVVEASLYSGARDRVLLHGVSSISELSPGQSEVVRFGPFSSIPASQGYLLEIDVKPSLSEANLANNVKVFQLNP
ncbi:MAG: hypothetical protein HYX92_03700 [Chloroflexi bacterium]|nr:hypothetical protein [Chloroflexota bacterium]